MRSRRETGQPTRHEASHDLAVELRGLFAAPVHVAARSLSDATPPLAGAEAAQVERAVEKRRHEFAVGRRCARDALAALGRPVGALSRGDDGAPLWPDGVVGSISHSRRWGAAVVAWRRDAAGVGLDIEETGRLSERAARHVLDDAERREVNAHVLGADAARTIAFSAKESIYKALYPSVRRYVDFLEAQVTVGGDGALEIVLDATLRAELPPGASLVGRWTREGGSVVTAITLLG